MRSTETSEIRVAVLCSGLGRVRRGYERFAHDLGKFMGSLVNVDVLGSASVNDLDVVKIPSFDRDGFISRIPIVRRQSHRNGYYWEAASFTVSALPRLISKRYDVLHVVDPPILNALYRSRTLVGLRSPIIFTNGVGMVDEACRRADHLHQVSPTAVAQMADQIPQEKTSLIPHPVDPSLLDVSATRTDARATLALPVEGGLVLSVAAMNRGHKRTDYLIEEVANCPSLSLVIVGRAEETGLLDLARRRLGGRFFHRELAFDEIGLAYRAANVFVSTSLVEGFGISLVEAMMAGCHVRAHDTDHFKWLMGDAKCLIDMTRPGELTTSLEDFIESHEHPPNETYRRRAIARFSWENLRHAYLDMYLRVASTN